MVGEPRKVAGSVHPVLLSNHPAIEAIRHRIGIVAKSTVPVFISGESGTGKEIVAQLIHAASERGGATPVALNCAAIPRDVIENELFGHEREAFTGAMSCRPGCFELADGGTLFLDEIAEMHPQVQAKLLRAIETKRFRRLGGHNDITVDVRIIAATNRDIPEALASGTLREDLFYRLSVVEIWLPPLRERSGDVPLLADYFLESYCEKYEKPRKFFSREVEELLGGYAWPGNVRELKNLVESLVLVCPDEEIQVSDIPSRITRAPRETGEVVIRLGLTLEEAERLYILRSLAYANGNKSAAARLLGLSRKSLYDRLSRFAKKNDEAG